MSTDNMVLARVEIEAASGLPRDMAVNTFHFHQRGTIIGFPSSADQIIDSLEDFYFTMDSELGDPLIQRLTTKAYTGKVTFKLYNMEDPSPRHPFMTSSRTASPMPSEGTLPTEVALVASWQAKTESGKPQARRRGRIFFPAPGVTQADVSGRPKTQFIQALANRCQNLYEAWDDPLSAWEWVVWSTVNNDHSLVDNGWVDNSWDTQRRRGWRATGRTTWS